MIGKVRGTTHGSWRIGTGTHGRNTLGTHHGLHDRAALRPVIVAKETFYSDKRDLLL
jgi:hypothetical protein